MDRVARLAMIARWKPVHLGHQAVLEALVEHAEHVLVGIGSANKYDAKNPFTPDETAAMIRLALGGKGSVEIVEVPDLGHGPRWRAMVVGMLGPLDLYVTANDYVRGLLEHDYRVVHPVTLVPEHRRIPLTGTMVRQAIARGEPWQEMVPEAVADYLESHGLIERFRRQFGLETLALEAADP